MMTAFVCGIDTAKARIRNDIPALFGYDLSRTLVTVFNGYDR
jgi:hypothetical protein